VHTTNGVQLTRSCTPLQAGAITVLGGRLPTTHKQVYIYGGLDTGPTEFNRSFGMSWGMGGWLLFPFLQRIGAKAAQSLRQRVSDELKTTFASTYSKEISLVEALQLESIAAYGLRSTGAKFLINPTKA